MRASVWRTGSLWAHAVLVLTVALCASRPLRADSAGGFDLRVPLGRVVAPRELPAGTIAAGRNARPVRRPARPATATAPRRRAVFNEDASSGLHAVPGVTAVATEFEGLANSDNEDATYSPPDVQGAAGPRHYVEMVNGEGRIFMRSGVARKSFPLSLFFRVGLGRGGTDPRIIFDALSNRWMAVFSQGIDGRGQVALAVSRTANPLLKWNVYALPSPNTPDFPGLGVSSDKIVVTAYGIASDEGGRPGSEYWVVSKADALAGRVLDVRFLPPRLKYSRMRPAQALSPGGPAHVVAQESLFSVDLITVRGVPGVSPVTLRTRTIETSGMLGPPGAPQPGTPSMLDTGSSLLQDAMWQEGHLWAAGNDSCTPAGDRELRSCIHLIEINTATGELGQDFQWGRRGVYYFYPALRTTQGGDLVVVFGVSSSTTYPSVRYAVRLAGDRPNTLRPSGLLKAGAGFDQSGRYGDYFGAAADPVNPNAVWIAGEYMAPTNGSDWRTYVGQVVIRQP